MAGSADLDTRVPAWFACNYCRITKQTFAYWVSSGKLSPIGTGSDGHPRYRFGDVLAAEQATRDSGQSRRGVTMNREPVGAPA